MKLKRTMNNERQAITSLQANDTTESPIDLGSNGASSSLGELNRMYSIGNMESANVVNFEQEVSNAYNFEAGQRSIIDFHKNPIHNLPEQADEILAMERPIETPEERMDLQLMGRGKMNAVTLQEKIERTDYFEKAKMGKILRSCLLAKYMENDNMPCKIQQGLYLGSIGAAFNKDLLQNLNVTHILSLASVVDMPFPHDFKYLQIDVVDGTDVDLAQYFDTCFSFINEARLGGTGVLVHCFAGRSRSVTVVVAYLMKTYKMRLDEAIIHVTSRRQEAQPNPGFMGQLRNYDHFLEEARRAECGQGNTT